MSTDMQVVCITHDPNISSDDIGNAYRDISWIREDIANRQKLVEAYDLMEGDDFWNSRRKHLMWFLSEHRNCNLKLKDEYGKEYPLVDEGLNEDRKTYPRFTLMLDNIEQISELTGWSQDQLATWYHEARSRGHSCIIEVTIHSILKEH